jgi:cystathionine gamma-synthase
VLRSRIAALANRACITPPSRPRPSPSDVFLFPTGMAAIYKTHTYLVRDAPAQLAVLFGMAFMNTITALDEFGPGCLFLGHGTDADLDALEAHLAALPPRSVSAVWAEFPANPLLATPDLARLRRLAHAHGAVLAVDDTIASWANVDVLAEADLSVASLTKSFNGYADAIAGCVILNPASPHYSRLAALFAAHYASELYAADADVLEANSRDYLARSAVLNRNALALARFLHSQVLDSPAGPVRAVYHPTTLPSGAANYAPLLRAPTAEFSAPGHGCLLSVELADMAATRAFYDALDVHKSVHLGAHRTLVFAYTAVAYGGTAEKRAWAAQYGMRETQVRVSVGLEGEEEIVGVFRRAVEAARGVWEARGAV